MNDDSRQYRLPLSYYEQLPEEQRPIAIHMDGVKYVLVRDCYVTENSGKRAAVA